MTFDPLKAYKTSTGRPKEYLKGKESLSEYKEKNKELNEEDNRMRKTVLNY